MIDPQTIRNDFPLLVAKPDLAYLDNAATSQKPTVVLEAMDAFYRHEYGSVRRGVHDLSESATAAYEGARQTTADFINASSEREIIFTRGTTEAVNLVLYSWAWETLKKGDVIVTTEMEHHSNYLPWRALADAGFVELRVIRITDSGELDMEDAAAKLQGAKLLAAALVSNVLGTVNPIAELSERAHAVGAKVLVDAAQAVAQRPVDVQALGADFLAFSAHKMFGPTGIGVLWAHQELLDGMRPFQYGGQMIKEVSADKVEYAEAPWRFEAGTMPVAEAVGLAAAINYLNELGMDAIQAHEQRLGSYALEQLSDIEGVTVFGPGDATTRGGLASFTVDGVHPHDLATILNDAGVAIRSGHHCAAPLHERLGVPATARASWSVYNSTDDIDRMRAGILDAKKTLAR